AAHVGDGERQRYAGAPAAGVEAAAGEVLEQRAGARRERTAVAAPDARREAQLGRLRAQTTAGLERRRRGRHLGGRGPQLGGRGDRLGRRGGRLGGRGGRLGRRGDRLGGRGDRLGGRGCRLGGRGCRLRRRSHRLGGRGRRLGGGRRGGGWARVRRWLTV